MTYLKHLRVGAAATTLMMGLAVCGGGAQAGALFLEPMSSGDFILDGQINDILGSIDGAGVTAPGGYDGSTIKLTSKSAATFTFLGFEAEHDNKFLLDANGNGSFGLIFSNRSGGGADINGKTKTAIGDTDTVVLDPTNFTAGIIPFIFKADVDGANGSIADGDLNDGTVNFFSSVDANETLIPASSPVLLFDDGGASVNDEHDGMGSRIAAVPVPEPGIMAILSVGLLALGWVGGRRKEKRAASQ